MNNILESVFKELIKKNIIITEAEEETVTSNTQTTGARTTLRLPKFKISEKNWGTKVSTEDRSFVELLGSRLPGKTPLERVKGAQAFLDSKDGVPQNITVGEVMANLMFLDIFASIVMDFNASVAGFLFEALFAGIFEGRQIPASEGGGKEGTTDIQIKTKLGEQDYSLKLLTEGNVVIKGSARDLLDGIASSPAKKEVYLVGLKKQTEESMTINFYEFDVGLDNWFDWIGRPAFKDKIVPVRFRYDGNRQITAEEPFKPVIDAILAKKNMLLAITKGDFDEKMQFIENKKTGKQEAIAVSTKKDGLRFPPYNLKHVVGGQLEDTNYLVVGQEYEMTVAHPTEKEVSFTDSAAQGAFMDLYGSLIRNPPAELEGKSFLEYIQNKDYLNDPELFFKILRKIPAFQKGGQFVISQPYLIEMVSAGQARGPATITLDRQKFLRAADNYAEKVGQQIYDLYTNLANLIDDVSGYFLGVTPEERNSFARKAKEEAGVVFKAAQKSLVEIESDVMRGVVLDPAPSSPSSTTRATSSSVKTMADIKENKKDLKDFSKSLLESVIKK